MIKYAVFSDQRSAQNLVSSLDRAFGYPNDASATAHYSRVLSSHDATGFAVPFDDAAVEIAQFTSVPIHTYAELIASGFFLPPKVPAA